MKRSITLGMGQLLVEGGEPARNLARAEELIQEARQRDCDLILLPETLDFGWTHPSTLREAQPVPGPFSDRLVELARRFQIYICAGLTEREGPKIYNAALLISPEGKILLRYHKINLLTVEQPFYAVGENLSVAETPFGIFGVNICSDNYPDGLAIGHTLARMGAQIILSPSSWTVDYSVDETRDPYKEKWLKPYATLAGLYDLVMVGTTSVGYLVGGPYEGKKMVGCSLAVGKEGVLARGHFNELASELIVVKIPVPERREKGTAIGERLRSKGHSFESALPC